MHLWRLEGCQATHLFAFNWCFRYIEKGFTQPMSKFPYETPSYPVNLNPKYFYFFILGYYFVEAMKIWTKKCLTDLDFCHFKKWYWICCRWQPSRQERRASKILEWSVFFFILDFLDKDNDNDTDTEKGQERFWSGQFSFSYWIS